MHHMQYICRNTSSHANRDELTEDVHDLLLVDPATGLELTDIYAAWLSDQVWWPVFVMFCSLHVHHICVMWSTFLRVHCI